MTHELAKELKDAGLAFEYPQTRENTYSYLDSDGNPCTAMGKDAAYIPTLSELIEACGEGFVGLDRSDDGWRATGFMQGSELTEGFLLGTGSTPEEAVARLWLAFNTKS